MKYSIIILAMLFFSCGSDLKELTHAMREVSAVIDSTSKSIKKLTANIDSIDSDLDEYFEANTNDVSNVDKYKIKSINLNQNDAEQDTLILKLKIFFDDRTEVANVTFTCPDNTKDWEVVDYEILE